MRIAYRYIFKELLGPMLFGVAAFVSIMVAGKPLMELTRLAFEGVAMSDVVKLFLLSLPSLVVLTLPMSMLLAALMGFGRLSGDSEMVAMYAGGMSLYRAAVPALMLAGMVTGLAIYLNESLVPWSIDAAKDLRERVVAQAGVQKKVELTLPQYNNTEEVGILRAQTFNPRTGEMGLVNVLYYDEGEPTRMLHADSATRRGEFEWTLRNGWYRELRPDAKSPTGFFTTWDIRVQQSLDEMEDQTKKPTELSISQLQRRIAALNRQGLVAEIPPFEVALWNRLAVPFASIVFALIGVSLGLRPQRASGGLGLGLSIVIIFLYWVVWDYTSKLGGLGQLPPFVASWTANGLGLLVGLALLWRAPK